MLLKEKYWTEYKTVANITLPPHSDHCLGEWLTGEDADLWTLTFNEAADTYRAVLKLGSTLMKKKGYIEFFAIALLLIKIG